MERSKVYTNSRPRQASQGGRLLAVAATILATSFAGCTADPPAEPPESAVEIQRVTPTVVTERVVHDADDPAIWIHPEDPSQSLILGTDKDVDGALYAFDLSGRVVGRVSDLKRPNNVDIELGLTLGGVATDIAVLTERYANSIRVFTLPDLLPVDGEGIEVFVGEEQRAPMGISLYNGRRCSP
jgi:3-phytase